MKRLLFFVFALTLSHFTQAQCSSGEVEVVIEINTDAYGEGWLFRLAPTDADAIDALLDADAYQALVDAEDH